MFTVVEPEHTILLHGIQTLAEQLLLEEFLVQLKQ